MRDLLHNIYRTRQMDVFVLETKISPNGLSTRRLSAEN